MSKLPIGSVGLGSGLRDVAVTRRTFATTHRKSNLPRHSYSCRHPGDTFAGQLLRYVSTLCWHQSAGINPGEGRYYSSLLVISMLQKRDIDV
ncbi:MAG: hypothetical protein ACTS5I_03750, partial [Rhodanobacter sp.]